MGERRGAGHFEHELVDVAPPPILTWFVGLDERVAARMEVCSGVPIRRAVTTADVTAGHAHPQVHPLPVVVQTVLAPFAARGDVAGLVEMRAIVTLGHMTIVIFPGRRDQSVDRRSGLAWARTA